VGDCNALAGWAADRNRLNTPINVSVFDGATLVTNVLANVSRPDVGSAVGDNGLHGFNIPTPASLKNGQPHTVSVKFETSNVELSTSPKTITCGTPVTPRDGVGTQVILALTFFRLNNGAASTKERIVDLNFIATERAGTTAQNVTANVTHYRVRESLDARDSNLSGQPWIPITSPLTLNLALRDGLQRRYGDRRVMFQVKTADLTSDVVSDTILLEPIALKEYRVDGGALIPYAASQGFSFPLDFYETCKGDCAGAFNADSSLDTGNAVVMVQGLSSGGGISIGGLLNAPAPGGTCRTKADYLLFEGRRPNPFWRIKSVAVSAGYIITAGVNRFRVKYQFDNKDGSCTPGNSISVGDVVLEGPEVDDFVDPANPWKNAFVH
jgi:hypothetical protein